MKPELLIPAALVLDALLGDPPRFPHPTRAMGALAQGVERALRGGDFARERPSACGSPRRDLLAGALGWLLVVGASIAAALLLMEAASALGGLAARWAGLNAALWSEAARAAAAVYLVYSAIAPRDLAAHALRVMRALSGKPGEGTSTRLAAGRRAVAMIVGRDTERLDEAGVIRAVVESVAESAIDGVCAPLFWAFALGPAGAVAYRAANTLDSLWGHKNARYLYYGRVAARADDLLTWPAARLGFLASIAAAALLSPFPGLCSSPRSALAIGLRDHGKHESPNSAWLEASFAGALGLELAGPAWYGGELCAKPKIGEPRRQPELADIPRAVALMYVTALVFAASGLVVAALLRIS